MDVNTRYPMALPIGSVLAGQYVIEGILGQGGFGITYAARDHISKKVVAVKEYFPDSIATRINHSTVVPFSGNKEENYHYGLECFKQEAYTLGKFSGHPNIVNIHCYFEENSTAYFVMDMIRGMSLASYMKQKKVLPYEEALKIILPVMKALVDVHKKGIIHRDISPDNIYLEDGGGIKLLDFGAARYSIGDRTQSLSIILKHGFAPPEQYQSRGRQGPYTDIYALAATFYNVLSGQKLPDSIERMTEDRLLTLSARGISLPYEADQAIMKALSIDRSRRFQNMQEFILALNIEEDAKAPTRTGISSAFVKPVNTQASHAKNLQSASVPHVTTTGQNAHTIQKPAPRSLPAEKKESHAGAIILISFVYCMIMGMGMYSYSSNKSDVMLYTVIISTAIYIILLIELIKPESPQRRYEKGIEHLKKWDFIEAERYLYPLMDRNDVDGYEIYSSLYKEALKAEQAELGERYLSEVRSAYGDEAAERLKNDR